MEITERIWRSKDWACKRVLPSKIGVTPQGRSRRLERALSDFGVEHSFQQAAARFQEHYGFAIPVYAVRTATLETSARAQAVLESQYEESFRSLPAKGAAVVVAQADGSMVCTVESGPRAAKRPRQWKEMRLLASRAEGRSQAVFAAGFLDVAQAGRRWGHCTKDAGWALESTIHVVADGAEWIRLQARETFGGQHQMLCDFYHVSEYLAAAGKNVAPIDPHAWCLMQQRRLKSDGLQDVLSELQNHKESPETPAENAPVNSALRYLENRSECLDYASAIKKELPIGSGLIESAHKHVLQARLKKAGSAWLPDNAHALAQLRVLRANQSWNLLWN